MDKKDILKFIDLFTNSSLAELSIEKKEFKLTLKKESAQARQITGDRPVAACAPPVAPGGAAPQAPAPSAEAAPPAEEDFDIIKAPLVGTLYRSPSPDSPPFIKEGQSVKAGETLCIIEAMKLMNEFKAEEDCTILEILSENGSFVEYGTPLFKVKKS